MNADQESLLLAVGTAGYIAVPTAALVLCDASSINLDASEALRKALELAEFKARRLLPNLVKEGLLSEYKKANALKVYALTKKGAAALYGLGYQFKITSTTKFATDAKHVFHRIAADCFAHMLKLLANAAQQEESSGEAIPERLCLRNRRTFEGHFQKLPDSIFRFRFEGSHPLLTWIEVDTARKKKADMLKLLHFVKQHMCLPEHAEAVDFLGSPEVLLWVCSPAAYTDAQLYIKKTFSVLSCNDSTQAKAFSLQLGNEVRRIVLLKADFTTLSDLHLRMCDLYFEALQVSFPADL